MLKGLRRTSKIISRYRITDARYENGKWNFGLVHCTGFVIIGTEINYQGMKIPRLMSVGTTVKFDKAVKDCMKDEDYMQRLLNWRSSKKKSFKGSELIVYS